MARRRIGSPPGTVENPAGRVENPEGKVGNPVGKVDFCVYCSDIKWAISLLFSVAAIGLRVCI